jgi:tetratricopeptide (TPR) repeat protein
VRLASVMEDEQAAISTPEIASSPIDRALQALWLRALHHDGQVERAMHWAVTTERHQLLDPYAAGIASLIALDASDLDAAQRWSAKASNGSATGTPAVEALTTMASLALGQRDEQRARSLIDVALRLQPTDGRLWSLQGFTDMLGGNPSAAMASFRRALEAMPAHIATWHGQGWAQVMVGDLRGAKASFEAALELDRELAESHAGLAVALAIQGQSDDARQHAKLALEREPENLAGSYARSLLSGKRQDTEELRSIAKQWLGGFTGSASGKSNEPR